MQGVYMREAWMSIFGIVGGRASTDIGASQRVRGSKFRSLMFCQRVPNEIVTGRCLATILRLPILFSLTTHVLGKCNGSTDRARRS